jgi:hypothetical protein
MGAGELAKGGVFDEEDEHLADMIAWAEPDERDVPDGVGFLGDCLDLEGAAATGLHVVRGFPAGLSGDNFYNLQNGGKHSSTIGGLLKAGHDIVSVEGIQDNPE